MSPRSQRSSYSKTKELSRRGSSTSPVEKNALSHSTSSSDRVLKVDSISTDVSGKIHCLIKKEFVVYFAWKHRLFTAFR